MCACVARAEVNQSLGFLESFVDKRKRIGEEGYVILLAKISEFKLKRASSQVDPAARAADVEAAAASLNASHEALDALGESDPAVHSAYFRAAAEYYKVWEGSCWPLRRLICVCVWLQIRGPASTFYANALQVRSLSSYVVVLCGACVCLGG